MQEVPEANLLHFLLTVSQHSERRGLEVQMHTAAQNTDQMEPTQALSKKHEGPVIPKTIKLFKRNPETGTAFLATHTLNPELCFRFAAVPKNRTPQILNFRFNLLGFRVLGLSI